MIKMKKTISVLYIIVLLMLFVSCGLLEEDNDFQKLVFTVEDSYGRVVPNATVMILESQGKEYKADDKGRVTIDFSGKTKIKGIISDGFFKNELIINGNNTDKKIVLDLSKPNSEVGFIKRLIQGENIDLLAVSPQVQIVEILTNDEISEENSYENNTINREIEGFWKIDRLSQANEYYYLWFDLNEKNEWHFLNTDQEHEKVLKVHVHFRDGKGKLVKGNLEANRKSDIREPEIKKYDENDLNTIGDYNNDGQINVSDLSLLLGKYKSTDNEDIKKFDLGTMGDRIFLPPLKLFSETFLNPDSKIDYWDIMLFLQSFGAEVDTLNTPISPKVNFIKYENGLYTLSWNKNEMDDLCTGYNIYASGQKDSRNNTRELIDSISGSDGATITVADTRIFSQVYVEAVNGTLESTNPYRKGETVQIILNETFEQGWGKYPWSLGGTFKPFIQSDDSSTGDYSLAFEGWGHTEKTAFIEIEVFTNEEVYITFDRKVDATDEEFFEGIYRFYIDGVLSGVWNGKTEWTKVYRKLEAGEHLLTWEFSGNGSMAYLDNVEIKQLQEIDLGEEVQFSQTAVKKSLLRALGYFKQELSENTTQRLIYDMNQKLFKKEYQDLTTLDLAAAGELFYLSDFSFLTEIKDLNFLITGIDNEQDIIELSNTQFLKGVVLFGKSEVIHPVDLPFLNNLQELRRLNIFNVNINTSANLNTLNNMVRCQFLQLNNTHLQSAGFLSAMKDLEYCDLSHNQLTSVGLSPHKDSLLWYCNLSHNQLISVPAYSSGPYRFEHLYYMNISNNKIDVNDIDNGNKGRINDFVNNGVDLIYHSQTIDNERYMRFRGKENEYFYMMGLLFTDHFSYEDFQGTKVPLSYYISRMNPKLYCKGFNEVKPSMDDENATLFVYSSFELPGGLDEDLEIWFQENPDKEKNFPSVVFENASKNPEDWRIFLSDNGEEIFLEGYGVNETIFYKTISNELRAFLINNEEGVVHSKDHISNDIVIDELETQDVSYNVYLQSQDFDALYLEFDFDGVPNEKEGLTNDPIIPLQNCNGTLQITEGTYDLIFHIWQNGKCTYIKKTVDIVDDGNNEIKIGGTPLIENELAYSLLRIGERYYFDAIRLTDYYGNELLTSDEEWEIQIIDPKDFTVSTNQHLIPTLEGLYKIFYTVKNPGYWTGTFTKDLMIVSEKLREITVALDMEDFSNNIFGVATDVTINATSVLTGNATITIFLFDGNQLYSFSEYFEAEAQTAATRSTNWTVTLDNEQMYELWAVGNEAVSGIDITSNVWTFMTLTTSDERKTAATQIFEDFKSQEFTGDAVLNGNNGEVEIKDNTVWVKNVWDSLKKSVDLNKEKLLPIKLDSSWGVLEGTYNSTYELEKELDYQGILGLRLSAYLVESGDEGTLTMKLQGEEFSIRLYLP